MKNRGLLARLFARSGKKTEPQTEVPTAPPPEEKGIKMVDPESGDVIEIFASIEDAVDKGFSRPNVVKAIKQGTKYKGHLWAE